MPITKHLIPKPNQNCRKVHLGGKKSFLKEFGKVFGLRVQGEINKVVQTVKKGLKKYNRQPNHQGWKKAKKIGEGPAKGGTFSLKAKIKNPK